MTEAAILTSTLGGTWHSSYGTAPCPVCQPERRRDQHGLSVSDSGGKLLAHCHKSNCAFEDIMRAAGLPRVSVDPAAQRETKEKQAVYVAEKHAKARNIWGYAKPVTRTKAEGYLRGRGITIPLPDSLRFLPDTYHAPSGRWLCAMVADVQPTGGIHRTYFTKHGQRIKKSAKMMLGPCAGGAVRLSDGAGPLVVCEGIETGLSLLSGLLSGPSRVWACLSTSGIKALRLPKDIGELIVATDGDEPGRDAGNALATRATALGWNVSLLDPGDGKDWNDVLCARGMAA